MKASRLSMVGLLFVSLAMAGLPAVASTPDGSTPAEETVCDPLMDEVVTPGLYGLCLAFCEAQDIASEDMALTDDEILALLNDVPSGSILQTYNQLRKESDPEMPCIVRAPEPSSCPCWTVEELAEIDIDANTPNGPGDTLCRFLVDSNGLVDTTIAFEIDTTINRATITAIAANQERFSPPIRRCEFQNLQVAPIIDRDISNLSSGEAAFCLDELITHCDSLGFPPPSE
jgi:hypothetical protein